MARPKSGKAPARPSRNSGRSPFWGWLLFAIALFATLAPVLTQYQLSDEGVTVLGAQRVARGEVPHRDFFTFIPPGSYYLLALPLKWAGETVWTVRATGATLGVVLLTLTWALARHLIPSPAFAAVPLGVLAMAGTGAWPFPSHHWLGAVLVSGSMLIALRARESAAPFRGAMAAGALAALAAWTLQDLGGLFILLAPPLWLAREAPERRRGLALGWAAGLLLAGLLPLIPLLATAGVARLWEDLVLYPLTAYWTIPGNQLGFLRPMQEVANQWSGGAYRAAPFYTLVASAAAAGLFLLPFVSIPALAASLRKKGPEGALLGLLAAGVIASALTASRRWAPINLMWGAGLPAVAAAWLLWRWWERSKGARRLFPVTLAVLLGGSCLCVGIARGLRALDPARRFAVQAPAGTLYDFDRRKARAVQELVEEVERRVPPGAPLLCREMPLLNFLLHRPNPCRYDLFFPPHSTTAAQVDEVVTQMGREKWEWLVQPVIPLVPEQPFDRALLEDYEPVWNNERYALLQRIDRRASPP